MSKLQTSHRPLTSVRLLRLHYDGIGSLESLKNHIRALVMDDCLPFGFLAEYIFEAFAVSYDDIASLRRFLSKSEALCVTTQSARYHIDAAVKRYIEAEGVSVLHFVTVEEDPRNERGFVIRVDINMLDRDFRILL